MASPAASDAAQGPGTPECGHGCKVKSACSHPCCMRHLPSDAPQSSPPVDSATARNVDAPPSNGADNTTPLNKKQPPKSDTPLRSVGDNAPVELTPAETALIRENEVAAKLAALAATNAALTAALNEYLSNEN
jgi:hypothetical protein